MPFDLISAFVRHLIESIFNPFFMIFFGCIGLMLRRLNEQSNRYQYAVYFFIFCLGCISFPWLPQVMVTALESHYPRVKTVDDHVHWIVVLGGGGALDGQGEPEEQLSSASLKRILAGVSLLKQLPDAKIVLSGKKVGVVMAAFAEKIGVNPSKIVIEAHSINTEDEAQAIAPIVKADRFYLVTSAIHMPRSMYLFNQQGLHPVAAPCDYNGEWKSKKLERYLVPNAANIHQLLFAWHEGLGLLWMRYKPSKYFSASNAAIQPNPAEVMACR